MTTDPEAVGPLRGTRPANRRQLIVDAAADLFYRNGFADVGMSDVAAAVAIGPSALYRHFRGKQDLLATVVSAALAKLAASLTAAESDESVDIATVLAAAAVDYRGVGVLWRREARHLLPAERKAMRAETRRIEGRVAAAIVRTRGDLGSAEADFLAKCALAVANSISFHGVSLPEPEFVTVLSDLVSSVLTARIPRVGERSTGVIAQTAGALTARSRREAILAEATRLFATNGYSSVSVDDIGACVGMAGPSVYNHFPNKSDILAAAIFRGDEYLQLEMNRAFAAARDPQDGLHRLLVGYCTTFSDNPHITTLIVSETMHLPEAERTRARNAQHSYIAEWVHLLRLIHPELDYARARLRVQAVQIMINEIVSLPSTNPTVPTALISIGADIFGIRRLRRS
ncbi:TetR/AcrR family transcriptional regulator [Antrihabitans sp. YC3-6]|uniref:TetR/AcrR family transcriptional regulator n=1 Tax=Antrihabitans stalagmiti TaxID=2799499 RepID=A0A934NRX7_9NOCA|nr:TetR/AcrR family transcriptional regulator [Antrihabitans stalagmiti]MBJ8340195.1 TetR/AcrR family transcriptional regulator [Antrihabitans stalagmiti]